MKPLNIKNLRKIIHKRAGTAPGTIEYIGEKWLDKTRITHYEYNESFYEETLLDDIDIQLKDLRQDSKDWIEIKGLHDEKIISKLGESFKIHPLILEDIANTYHRPKIEIGKESIFIVLKILDYIDETEQISTEQVNIIFGENYLISLQEKDSNAFEPVLDRIKTQKTRILKFGVDYLCYALIDAVIDHYLIIIDKIEEKIDQIEEMLINSFDKRLMTLINKMKNNVLVLNKSISPLTNFLFKIESSETSLIKENTRYYFNDIKDHIDHCVEVKENLRERINSLMDTYLTQQSNKMNETMMVLTIIATIFIPLTFIVGVYGMNFKYMPELELWWTYPAVWIIMIVTAVIMLVQFKRKNWF